MTENTDKTRFNTQARPNWCPGCGNFGIQTALKKALLELEMQPHRVVMSSGIGCSSKIAHWVNIYGLHGLHGRALPIAAGMKLGNHDLTVIAEGGDGDGLSEGLNHFLQAARRNVDFTYVLHNNNVFSLTTGQAATTANQGAITASTPQGAIEPPYQPCVLALASGAGFVARAFSGDSNQLKDLLVAAVKHPGFAFIEVLQVCVTYNPAKGYKWYQERVYKLDETGYQPDDRQAALRLALDPDPDRLATGILYQGESRPYREALPMLHDGPLADRPDGDRDIDRLMHEFI